MTSDSEWVMIYKFLKINMVHCSRSMTMCIQLKIVFGFDEFASIKRALMIQQLKQKQTIICFSILRGRILRNQIVQRCFCVLDISTGLNIVPVLDDQ